jgi:Nucleotidyltransferase domain
MDIIKTLKKHEKEILEKYKVKKIGVFGSYVRGDRTEIITPNDNISFPIGMTVREGNVNDQTHFNDTFDQVNGALTRQEGNGMNPLRSQHNNLVRQLEVYRDKNTN